MEMMSWGPEFLHQAPPNYSANWFLDFPAHHHQASKQLPRSWTPEENKVFEQALAIHDGDTPDRWLRVAEITGKSVEEVKTHYSDLEKDVRQIESGLVSIPEYSSPPFTLDWTGSGGGRGHAAASCGGGGRRPGPGGGRGSDHERKKGVPWSEEEHRQFLLGLNKYGKGDWRSISRNYVQTRTPTQVASHAQKYFIRLTSGGKDKRRSSIHDITVPDDNSATTSVTDMKQQQQHPQPLPAATTAPVPVPQHEPPQPGVHHFASTDTTQASEPALFHAMLSQADQYSHKLADGIRESLQQPVILVMGHKPRPRSSTAR